MYKNKRFLLRVCVICVILNTCNRVKKNYSIYNFIIFIDTECNLNITYAIRNEFIDKII